MDVHASLDAPCAPGELFVLVDDLARYPSWIDMVHRVEPIVGEPAAWMVELRARMGPLARSKRLRMERTVHDPSAGVAVFERREADGRRHSAWVLRAAVDTTVNTTANTTAGTSTSTLRMHLHYGGGLWTGGVLERVLADQITNGRERLLAMLQTTR